MFKVWDPFSDHCNNIMRGVTYNSALRAHREGERDGQYFEASFGTDCEETVDVYYDRVLLFVEVQVGQKSAC